MLAATVGAAAAYAAPTKVEDDANFTFTAASADQLTTAKLHAYKVADFYREGDGAQNGGQAQYRYSVRTVAGADREKLAKALIAAGIPEADVAKQKSDASVDLLVWAFGRTGAFDASQTRPWDVNAASAGASRKFADAIAKENPFAETQVPAITPMADGAVQKATIQLPAGVYLFTDTAQASSVYVPAVPMMVSSAAVTDGTITDPKADAVIELKGSTVTDKNQIKKTSGPDSSQNKVVAIGQKFTYQLFTDQLPNPIPEDYEIRDIPSAGLTVTRELDGWSYQTGGISNANGWDPLAELKTAGMATKGQDGSLRGQFFTIDFSHLTAEGTGGIDPTDSAGKNAAYISIKFTDKGRRDYAGKRFRISYEATVNDKATTAGVWNRVIKNGADHTAVPADDPSNPSPNDPNDADGSVNKTVNPVGRIVFNKVDAFGGNVAGAQFTLAPKGAVTATTNLLPVDAQGQVPASLSATSNQNGAVEFIGMSTGTYTVTETKVADGFHDFKASFDVTIKGDGTVEYSRTAVGDPFDLVTVGGTYNVFNPGDSFTATTVKNVRSVSQLPLTGAAGAVLFALMAVVTMTGGSAVYLFARRMRARGRAV